MIYDGYKQIHHILLLAPRGAFCMPYGSTAKVVNSPTIRVIARSLVVVIKTESKERLRTMVAFTFCIILGVSALTAYLTTIVMMKRFCDALGDQQATFLKEVKQVTVNVIQSKFRKIDTQKITEERNMELEKRLTISKDDI